MKAGEEGQGTDAAPGTWSTAPAVLSGAGSWRTQPQETVQAEERESQ